MFPPHNSPHKGLRLKTPKPKTSSQSATCNLPIVKTKAAMAGAVSTAKAGAALVKPAVLKSLHSKETLNKPEIDLVAMVAQAMMQETRDSLEKSLLYRTKPSVSKIDTGLSAPNLKLQRHKRISIIPKKGRSSLFSPEESLNKIPFEPFSDEGCQKSPTPRSRRVETPSGDIYLPEKRTKDKLNGKMGAEVRPSLSLPIRRTEMKTETETESKRRVPYKTVRWDLATVTSGLSAPLSSEESTTVTTSHLVDKTHCPSFEPNVLGPEECLESIQGWSKRDRERVEHFLRALRELDYKSATTKSGEEFKTSCPGEQVALSSLREPDLISKCGDESKTPWTEEQVMPRALKELVYNSEAAKHVEEFKTINPKERVTVKTMVKSLDPRVPEFQPLQSINELPWRPKRPLPHPVAPKKEEAPTDENVPPELRTAIESPRNNPRRKPNICDDYQASGREVDSFQPWYAERQLIEFMKKYPQTGNKAPPRKKLPVCRRSDVVATSGPTAGRNAAAIQQRLEFLLWKNKEKKVLEQYFPVGCS